MREMQCEKCPDAVIDDNKLMGCNYSTDGWSGVENYCKSTDLMSKCGRMFDLKYEEPAKLNHIEKRLAAIV